MLTVSDLPFLSTAAPFPSGLRPSCAPKQTKGYLFMGAHQFLLGLNVYNLFSIHQNNIKRLVHLRVYTSDGSFVAFVGKKLLWVAKV